MRELLVTCEHGGNAVPAEYADLFAGAADVLESHRGHDPGALLVALQLAEACAAPIIISRTTRLLVELNRSPHSPELFSEFTRDLTDEVRARIVAGHYTPYRRQVERLARIAPTLHVSMHSFTDVFHGVRRELDVGVLFDPGRPAEAAFGRRLMQLLASDTPLIVHENQPYLGTDDGLTTYLRTQLPDTQYAGIEIELRQGLLRDRPAVGDQIIAAVRSALSVR